MSWAKESYQKREYGNNVGIWFKPKQKTVTETIARESNDIS